MADVIAFRVICQVINPTLDFVGEVGKAWVDFQLGGCGKVVWFQSHIRTNAFVGTFVAIDFVAAKTSVLTY